VGHGWEVVETYISGQKGYEKTDTVPVIDEEKEKLRAHKTWYTSLYTDRFKTNFLEGSIKNKKIEKLLYSCDIPVITV